MAQESHALLSSVRAGSGDIAGNGKDRHVGSNTSQESREMLSVSGRLAHMDELDIEVQVLYPTLFLRPVVHDRDRERALRQSYNRWLADIWRRGDGRLRWVVTLPLGSLETTPQLMRDEIAWAKDNGACGIFMRGCASPASTICRSRTANANSIGRSDAGRTITQA